MSGLSTGSLDESSLLSMIRDLEATVAKIDKEMEDLTKGSLTKHLQAQSQGYLTKIHQIEADVSKSLFRIGTNIFSIHVDETFLSHITI